MTCNRDTYIGDWNTISDAVHAWQNCQCMVCADALGEVPKRIKNNANQTTL